MRRRRLDTVAACLILGCLSVPGLTSAAARSTTVRHGPESGLAGRVVAGPSCPVESVPPRPGCEPRPVEATLSIRRRARNAKARLVRCARDGRFSVALAPGVYSVRALRVHGRAFPRPPAPARVRVFADRYTEITITYDTGIR